MEFTEDEKKALLKKTKPKPKQKHKNKEKKGEKKNDDDIEKQSTNPKVKKVPICEACGGNHYMKSGKTYNCTDKAALKKFSTLI